MALTTTKMGLASWNDASDDYDYQQLANNWQLLDFHDHTTGRGVPIGPGGIGPGAVLAQSIAAGVIGEQHLSSALMAALGLSSERDAQVAQVTSAAAHVAAGDTTEDAVDLTVAAGALVAVTFSALTTGSATAKLAVQGDPVGPDVAVATGDAPTGPTIQNEPIYVYMPDAGTFTFSVTYSGDEVTNRHVWAWVVA